MPAKTRGSMASWNPGAGKPRSSNEQLLSTEAKDAPDTMNATNELKPFMGKSGKPPGPYGIQGREF